MLSALAVHQPHSRDLDWKMVACNGLGLAFFFVPGVIAFAVDFYTGAIYLPPHQVMRHPHLSEVTPTDDPAVQPASADSPTQPAGVVQPASAEMPAVEEASPAAEFAKTPAAETEASGQRVKLQKVPVSGNHWNLAQVEREVSAQIGQPVLLNDPQVRASKLETLDQFSEVQRQHEAGQGTGVSPRRFLERWLPDFLQ